MIHLIFYMFVTGEQQSRLWQWRQVCPQEHGGGQQETIPLHGRENNPRLCPRWTEVYSVLLLHRGNCPCGLQGNIMSASFAWHQLFQCANVQAVEGALDISLPSCNSDGSSSDGSTSDGSTEASGCLNRFSYQNSSITLSLQLRLCWILSNHIIKSFCHFIPERQLMEQNKSPQTVNY